MNKWFSIIPPAVLIFLLAGFMYGFLAVAAIYLSSQKEGIATLWYANAFAIVFLLRQPRALILPIFVAIFLANFGANLVMGSSWGMALGFVIPNLLEIAAAVFLIQITDSDRQFNESPQLLLRFLVVACALPPLLGATAGAAVIAYVGSPSFGTVWPAWYTSSTIGSIGMMPLALLIKQHGLRQFFSCVGWKATLPVAACAVVISLLALLYLPSPFIYLTVPLMLAAVILSFEGAAITVWLTSLTSGVLIAISSIQFDLQTIGWALLLLYIPMLLTMISPLVLAASMKQGRQRERGRRTFEEALEKKNEELQTIIDHMPAMIGYWGADLRNRFGNRNYLEWFGVDREQLANRHLREVIGEETYELNQSYIQGALKGQPQVFERTLINQSGQARFTLASYIPDISEGQVKGFYAFVTDITSLKQAQQKQQEAQSQLQGVIDAASEFSIIATDLEGVIRVFSVGAERMLGYRAEELVDVQTPAILHVAEEVIARGEELTAELGYPVQGFEVFVVMARQGLAEQREWTYIRKDGSRLPVNLTATAIKDHQGKITGFLGIANDISQQKQMLNTVLQAKEQAEAASQAKSDFVANMSHEIRTPMNAVLGMARLLADTPLSLEQKKYLDMIQVSGQSLLVILNDILDFSKIEAGRMELAPEVFEMDDLLLPIANLMAVNAGIKNLELAVGLVPEVPKTLLGDAPRLQQILVNLIGNAIKFTEQGTVSLHVGRVADVQATGDQVWICFRVRDTGIGMSAEQQTRLFQAFSQADSSMTRRFGGTGLGLTISRRLVDLMGGRIEVKSTLGQGSEFQVLVPLGVVEGSPKASPHPLQVLLIDDHELSRDYLSQSLQAAGCGVDSVSRGMDAVQLAGTKRYDVVVLDAHQPDMNGLATLHALREMEAMAGVPMLLMVSTKDRDALIKLPYSSQADAILTKPLLPSAILNVLNIPSNAEMKVNPQEPDTPVLESEKPLAGVHLLLVEDNSLNQIVARGLLQKAGASLDVADNGEKAVAMLRENPQAYRLVLMDIQMPVMDGFTATRLIRTELELSLPILAMSAGVMVSEQNECTSAGMNDFIAKPIDYAQMLEAIQRHLS